MVKALLVMMSIFSVAIIGCISVAIIGCISGIVWMYLNQVIDIIFYISLISILIGCIACLFKTYNVNNDVNNGLRVDGSNGKIIDMDNPIYIILIYGSIEVIVIIGLLKLIGVMP